MQYFHGNRKGADTFPFAFTGSLRMKPATNQDNVHTI